MITIIFFALLIGFFVALIIGTLGDEINDFLFRVADLVHSEPVERKLRHYQEVLKR